MYVFQKGLDIIKTGSIRTSATCGYEFVCFEGCYHTFETYELCDADKRSLCSRLNNTVHPWTFKYVSIMSYSGASSFYLFDDEWNVVALYGMQTEESEMLRVFFEIQKNHHHLIPSFKLTEHMVKHMPAVYRVFGLDKIEDMYPAKCQFEKNCVIDLETHTILNPPKIPSGISKTGGEYVSILGCNTVFPVFESRRFNCHD